MSESVGRRRGGRERERRGEHATSWNSGGHFHVQTRNRLADCRLLSSARDSKFDLIESCSDSLAWRGVFLADGLFHTEQSTRKGWKQFTTSVLSWNSTKPVRETSSLLRVSGDTGR